MKGLRFLGDRRIELREYPDPVPGPGEVLVKLARAAVCGTNVHLWRAAPEAVPRLPDGSSMIPGHEPAGWVAALGPGARGVAIGDRVLLAGVMGCGVCEMCRDGINNACEDPDALQGMGWNRHGADATHIVVPAANAIRLPDAVSFETATVLTCAGGTAYTIVRETGLTGEDRLAILGLGPVGQCLLILAKSLGCSVAGVDLSPERLRQAQALGIDLAVNARQIDPVAAVRAWTGGRGCEVTAECVGLPLTQTQTLAMARKRGRAAMAGLGAAPVTINIEHEIMDKHLRVIGIAATPIRYFAPLIERAARLKLPFEHLITHRFALEEANAALALMESGKSGKVMFEIAD